MSIMQKISQKKEEKENKSIPNHKQTLVGVLLSSKIACSWLTPRNDTPFT